MGRTRHAAKAANPALRIHLPASEHETFRWRLWQRTEDGHFKLAFDARATSFDPQSTAAAKLMSLEFASDPDGGRAQGATIDSESHVVDHILESGSRVHLILEALVVGRSWENTNNLDRAISEALDEACELLGIKTTNKTLVWRLHDAAERLLGDVGGARLSAETCAEFRGRFADLEAFRRDVTARLDSYGGRIKLLEKAKEESDQRMAKIARRLSSELRRKSQDDKHTAAGIAAALDESQAASAVAESALGKTESIQHSMDVLQDKLENNCEELENQRKEHLSLAMHLEDVVERLDEKVEQYAGEFAEKLQLLKDQLEQHKARITQDDAAREAQAQRLDGLETQLRAQQAAVAEELQDTVAKTENAEKQAEEARLAAARARAGAASAEHQMTSLAAELRASLAQQLSDGVKSKREAEEAKMALAAEAKAVRERAQGEAARIDAELANIREQQQAAGSQQATAKSELDSVNSSLVKVHEKIVSEFERKDAAEEINRKHAAEEVEKLKEQLAAGEAKLRAVEAKRKQDSVKVELSHRSLKSIKDDMQMLKIKDAGRAKRAEAENQPPHH